MKDIPEHVTYRGHTLSVWALAWSPDGHFIASGGRDTIVHVWRVSDGETLCVYREPASDVQALAWSPDSTRLVSGYYNEKAYVWKALTGETLLTYQGHTHEIVSVSWFPHTQHIASASNFGRVVHVWDATTGNYVFTCEDDYVEYEATSWSPSGSLLACVGDTQLQLWDVAAQKMTALLQVTDTSEEIDFILFHGRLMVVSLPLAIRMQKYASGILLLPKQYRCIVDIRVSFIVWRGLPMATPSPRQVTIVL